MIILNKDFFLRMSFLKHDLNKLEIKSFDS